MTPRQRTGIAERLNLLNEGEGASVTEVAGNVRSRPKRPMCFQNTPKRRTPRKPSPAQIARFEALRARIMGIPESR